jgi:hypothetical protein
MVIATWERSRIGGSFAPWTLGGIAAADLTGVTYAPLAAGDPSACVATDGSRRIVYRDGNGRIHEIVH